MTTRKPTDDKRNDLQPGEAALSGLYQNAAHDMPPPALDREILALSRQATSESRSRGGFTKRWAVPVSVAALVVLSVSVVLQVSLRDTTDYPASTPTVAETPMAKSIVPERAREQSEAPTESKATTPGALPAAPPSHADIASSANVEQKREMAADAATPTARRAEKSAPMASEQRAAGVASLQAGKTMNDKANVISVRVSGQPGAYDFDVGIRSPDTGCKQYADWWEVVSEDGKLLYRRVLLHSHVDEQPFSRNGGPVPIQPNTVVLVRAHMNASGYGGDVFKGSVTKGFTKTDLAADFAAALAKQQPLPQGCDF